MEENANLAVIKQYIVVPMGNEYYGINIQLIDNIVRMQKITRVPKAQSYFCGVINLRGEIIPVMSMRRKMGLEDDIISKDTRIIIIKLEPQYPVGIIVDSVKEVISLDEDRIEKSLYSNKDNQGYISGIGKHEDQLISLLDISKIISD